MDGCALAAHVTQPIVILGYAVIDGVTAIWTEIHDFLGLTEL
jgi:Flp pilus assembly pilin Flp